MAYFADEALPALPPIKMAPLAPSPSAAPSSPAAPPQVSAVEDHEPSTPTSEESRLRPPTECPPAPRKPAPAPRLPVKRKSSTTSSARVCLRVPRDLSVVFRSMPMPPEKRIRAS